MRSMAIVPAVSGVGAASAVAVCGLRAGRSDPRPLPRTRRMFSGLFTVQDLLCQLNIALGAFGARVVGENRLAEAGRLGEFYAAWNDGFENLVLKEFAKVGGDLAREIGAVVVHRQQDACDLDGVVKGFANPVDGIHELGNTFKGEELALNRYDRRIGCDEGVEGEEIEGGRAVDDDEVELPADIGEALTKAEFALGDIYQFEIGPGEIFIGRDDGDAIEGGRDDCVGGRGFGKKEVVGAGAAGVLGYAEAASGIALWIIVYDQDA